MKPNKQASTSQGGNGYDGQRRERCGRNREPQLIRMRTGDKKGKSAFREVLWEGDVQEAKPSRMSGRKPSARVQLGGKWEGVWGVGEGCEGAASKNRKTKNRQKPESGDHSGDLKRSSIR